MKWLEKGRNVEEEEKEIFHVYVTSQKKEESKIKTWTEGRIIN